MHRTLLRRRGNRVTRQPRSAWHNIASAATYAATVAVVTSDHGPFSPRPRVLMLWTIETAADSVGPAVCFGAREV